MNKIDFVILFAYLAVLLAIGLKFRVRRGEDSAGYFLAGRNMGWFPIGLSVMVTVFSAINYTAMPNEVFGFGLYVIAAFPVFFLAAWIVNKFWMPFFHGMQLTSAYEYLEKRFDRRVRRLGSGIFILWRMFWMATALYAASKVCSLLTDLPLWSIILTGGLVAVGYTFIGGMRAVMWTDVCQFFVLFGGIAAGLFLSVKDGGFETIFQTAYEGGRLKPFAPFDPQYLSLDPRIRMTLWSGLIGVLVAFLGRYGGDQVVMQRYFTAKSLKAAQRGLWFNAAVSVISLVLLALFGLAVYSNAVNSGQLTPQIWEKLSGFQRKGFAMKQLAMMIKSFPAGVTGLVAAGLLAATMSSIDSGINACSAAFACDFYNADKNQDNTKRVSSILADKIITLAFGAAAIAFALVLIPLVGKSNTLFMIVNKLINAMGSPLLALIALGMFCPVINAPGAFWGGLTGFICSLCVSLFVKPLALQYYSVANLLICVGLCLIFSRIASLSGHTQSEEKLCWCRRGEF